MGFERNDVIIANLLNLEFLFTDETAEDYSLNRYFGLYVNEVEEGSFALDGERFYTNGEKSQTPKIAGINTISEDLNDKFLINNNRGVLLYTKDVNSPELT